MDPIHFPEETGVLEKPDGMSSDDCGPLPAFTNGVVCVSRWQASWSERLSILFRGRIWLQVLSGHTQPPVSITIDYPFFVKEEDK